MASFGPLNEDDMLIERILNLPLELQHIIKDEIFDTGPAQRDVRDFKKVIHTSKPDQT